jgi:cyclopropane fatty-acyl-phospholipid synthase-like methyltransferase
MSNSEKEPAFNEATQHYYETLQAVQKAMGCKWEKAGEIIAKLYHAGWTLEKVKK